MGEYPGGEIGYAVCRKRDGRQDHPASVKDFLGLGIIAENFSSGLEHQVVEGIKSRQKVGIHGKPLGIKRDLIHETGPWGDRPIGHGLLRDHQVHRGCPAVVGHPADGLFFFHDVLTKSVNVSGPRKKTGGSNHGDFFPISNHGT